MPRWDPFDYRPRHGRRFEKGDMRFVILDLLKERPSYGYEIIRALEERFHGWYTPSPGVVYPTLQMLEEQGLVTSEAQDGRKVYTITEAGLQFLKEREEQAEQVRGRMRDWWDPDLQRELKDIMEDLGRLMGRLGREFRRTDAAKLHRIHEVINRAGGEIEDILKDRPPERY